MADQAKFDKSPVGRSTGPHLHFNASGKPEIVLPPAEATALAAIALDGRAR